MSDQGKVQWEYPAPACNDLVSPAQRQPVVQHRPGAKEVTRNKEVCFRLSNPRTKSTPASADERQHFIGECSAGRLMKSMPAGKIVTRCGCWLEGKKAATPSCATRGSLANGDYLVTYLAKQVVRRSMTTRGRCCREIPAAGGAHSVARLPQWGHPDRLRRRQGGSRVFEMDAAGKSSGRCWATNCRASA